MSKVCCGYSKAESIQVYDISSQDANKLSACPKVVDITKRKPGKSGSHFFLILHKHIYLFCLFLLLCFDWHKKIMQVYIIWSMFINLAYYLWQKPSNLSLLDAFKARSFKLGMITLVSCTCPWPFFFKVTGTSLFDLASSDLIEFKLCILYTLTKLCT